MTTEEFREATAVLHNFRDSKAKIVRMIAVSFEPESYFVVLGDTIYCTLKEYLRTNGNKMLNRNVLFQYAAQVADGMAFLERNNVINRYLRADCVVVCYPYVVKIAHPKLNDLIFGSVATGNIQDPFEMDKWKWTAPEAINDEQKYSTNSDVWSYGVLLYELITFGEEPYKGLSAEEALRHLGRGNRPQRPYDSTERCPLAFYVTMLKCWHERPECRPTFEFLRELFLDFDNIELLDIGSEELTSCGKINANAATVIEQQTKQGSGGSQGDSQPTHIESAERNVTLEQATNKAEDKQGCRFSCVKALYSYEAADVDEITLNKDDVITDVYANNDEGWWIGTTFGGKRGMFPSNYVEVLEEKHKQATQSIDNIDEPLRRGFSVKAEHNFKAGDYDEISLKRDDVITDVDHTDNDGWWIGTAPDGKRGRFPSIYVIEIKDDGDEISLNKDDVKTDVDPNEVDPYDERTTHDGKRGMIPSNNGEVLEGKELDLPIRRGFSARALYDYVAERDDEISICKDDIITDIDPAEDIWWEGTAPDGTRGMFLSSFVEVFESCYAEITKL